MAYCGVSLVSVGEGRGGGARCTGRGCKLLHCTHPQPAPRAQYTHTHKLCGRRRPPAPPASRSAYHAGAPSTSALKDTRSRVVRPAKINCGPARCLPAPRDSGSGERTHLCRGGVQHAGGRDISLHKHESVRVAHGRPELLHTHTRTHTHTRARGAVTHNARAREKRSPPPPRRVRTSRA